jgi:uncharacterized damage-inducible protein DinB
MEARWAREAGEISKATWRQDRQEEAWRGKEEGKEEHVATKKKSRKRWTDARCSMTRVGLTKMILEHSIAHVIYHVIHTASPNKA